MLERHGISPIRRRNFPDAVATARLVPSARRTTTEAIPMTETILIDVEALIGEIARYLAAVDLFRAEGHEPCWS
jgi:hypothetical protein